MKKILLVNTKYREFGGEDSNFKEELKFLSAKFEVDHLEYENSGSLSVFDFLAFISNSNYKSNALLRNKVTSFKPDIVYIHNTWFKANLGIFRTLEKLNIPVIQKIHNFRFSCTSTYSGSKHLDGQDFCHKCGFGTKNRYFNKYFKESIIKSFFVIKYGKKYLNILKTQNMKILVMTEFQKNYLKDLGVDSDKIHIYENPVNLDNNDEIKYNPHSNYIIYAGRVSEAKGVRDLIQTWIQSDVSGITLKIAGEGDLLLKLQKEFENNKVEFLGSLSNTEVLNIIKQSRAVVTSTKMYEGQPRLLCEASLYGIPSIYPYFGGMPEFYEVNYMYAFKQYDYEDLNGKFELLLNTDSLNKASKEVRKYIIEKLSTDKLLNKFESITQLYDK